MPNFDNNDMGAAIRYYARTGEPYVPGNTTHIGFDKKEETCN